jgi:hypothetical protein
VDEENYVANLHKVCNVCLASFNNTNIYIVGGAKLSQSYSLTIKLIPSFYPVELYVI